MKGARRWRVALTGYYGFGNLGDELLLRASLEALGRCGVGLDSLVVLSNDPEGTARDFGVAAVFRWSFREVRRALASSETLLLGGGGLFQDSTSLKSCLWYWGLVRLACLCGARPWALGQSIGPLRRSAARWLTRDALGRCSVLHLRDTPSLEWAGRLGLGRAVLGGDLALTLDPPAARRQGPGPLLLNLRPAEGIDRFVDAAAPCVDAFVRDGGEAVGAALSSEDGALLNRLRTEGRLPLSRVVLLKTLEEAGRLWSGARQAIGMRLHFAVLSTLFNVPLAVLSYDPKVADFAGRVGVPDLMEHQDPPRLLLLPFPAEALRAELDGLCRQAERLS